MEDKILEKFDLLTKLVKNSYKNPDFAKLNRAFEFARLAHASEKRLSGEDFVRVLPS